MKREPAVIIASLVGVAEAAWSFIATARGYSPALVGSGLVLIAAVGGAITRCFVSPAPRRQSN